MSSYLITGCTRGIGLELVKQLLQQPASSVGTVIATGRGAAPSAALAEIITKSEGRGHYVPLDALSKESIQAAASQASSLLGEKGLDVLVNNAGIAPMDNKEGTLSELAPVLATNVIAVSHVTDAFLSLLRKGKEKKIVNVSSSMGSIALCTYNPQMPAFSYRISKTALNMMTVQYAQILEADGFTVFALSPGWNKTDMGGSGADLDPAVGTKAVIDIILNSTKADNGAFKNILVPGFAYYDGKNIPW